jgi:hypothetical protein
MKSENACKNRKQEVNLRAKDIDTDMLSNRESPHSGAALPEGEWICIISLCIKSSPQISGIGLQRRSTIEALWKASI